MEKAVSRLWKKNTVELGLLEKTSVDGRKIGSCFVRCPNPV